jgi:tetratricopeptide (TPR) repeat protein
MKANDIIKKPFALYTLNRYDEAIKCFDKSLEISLSNSKAKEYNDKLTKKI